MRATHLLGRLTKMVVEGALEGELDDHLGYGKHRPTPAAWPPATDLAVDFPLVLARLWYGRPSEVQRKGTLLRAARLCESLDAESLDPALAGSRGCTEEWDGVD